MTDSERRRRRPTTACTVCRRRKIRCNRESPCSNCLRSRKTEACVYEDEPSQASRGWPRRSLKRASELNNPLLLGKTSTASPISPASIFVRSSAAHVSTASSSVVDYAPSQDIDSTRARIRQLEKQLYTPSHQTLPSSSNTPASQIESTTTQLGGTFHQIHHPSRSVRGSTLGSASAVAQNVSNKTRLFGQSHWVNSLAPSLWDIVQLAEPYLKDGSCQVLPMMQKCKELARNIKAKRAPPWPSPPTTDLPDKDIADQLVDNYHQTIETIYRILHIPTFKRDYEALWASLSESIQCNTAFLVQLKLVLALGAVTHDDKFSLRTSAVKWVHEAKTYLSEPVFKSRLSIQTLQTQILLLLAQELVDVGGDSVWIATGSLVRTAITLGLHRDPSGLPEMFVYQAEMRRRLWSTVLEVSLQASVWSGGPPLLAEEDFDVQPPRNFDDESLLGDDAVPKSDNVFTETSVALALRATFPMRLKIVKSLNDLHSGVEDYAATLRLDGEIRQAFKNMRQALQQRTAPSSTPPAFAAKAVDFIMLHYLSSLHAPYFGPSAHEAAYAFSRKVLIDTSLKLWGTVWPSSAIAEQQDPLAQPDLLARFVWCGAGFFRTGAFRAAHFISAELRSQLHEDEGLVPLRTDLLAVVDESRLWNIRCVEAGETNVKGNLVGGMIAAHVEGLRRGLGPEEMGRAVMTGAEKVLEWCLGVLSAMAAALGIGTEERGEGFRGEGEAGVENWNFNMPDAMLFPTEDGALDWAFDDSSMEALSLW